MSVRQNDTHMQDFTLAVNKLPRAWNLLESMNLDEKIPVKTTVATVDVETDKTVGFGDMHRGGARQVIGSETSITKHLSIPFFPLDRTLRPSDLQNLREIGTASDLKSTDVHLRKIMERIRRAHGVLREKALMEAIKGKSFSPNGTTEQYDYYNVFEVSTLRLELPMDLTNAATNVLAEQEKVRAHIIDNADDGAGSYRIFCLASPEFFDDLLKNDTLMSAYLYYQDGAQPLRDRMGGDSIGRRFEYGNIVYQEYRGAFNGQRLIPANEAFYVPYGIADMFQTYHAPADKMAYANTFGEEMYLWVYDDPKGRKMDVESETSFLVVNSRPELSVRATSKSAF